jgi:hypothetical protein
MVTCEARREKRYWLLHFTFRLSAPNCGICASAGSEHWKQRAEQGELPALAQWLFGVWLAILAGLAKSWTENIDVRRSINHRVDHSNSSEADTENPRRQIPHEGNW